MRIKISGQGDAQLPSWRIDAKKRMRWLPGSISREIRQCVAENMERESLKRAFKAMGQRGKTEFREQEKRYRDAKFKAVEEWKKHEIEAGELDEYDIAELADRATLSKAGKPEAAKARRRYRAVKWKSVKIGGKWRRVATHYKLRELTKDKRRKLTGKLIPAADIKRSMALSSYWGRIRALAEAMQITRKDGKLDLIRARKVDKKMMNVPDSIRRRIYDECVEKAALGYMSPFEGSISRRGIEVLPKSRKEGREGWGAVGDGHGNRARAGGARHRSRSSRRGGNPQH